MMSSIRRAELVVSIVALVLGIAGAIVARNLSFTEPTGELVLSFGPSFNLLGALIMIVLAALALAGALLGRHGLVLASAGGFLLIAIQVLLQFGRSTNWLGTRGSNLALAVGLGVGLAALVLTERRRL